MMTTVTARSMSRLRLTVALAPAAGRLWSPLPRHSSTWRAARRSGRPWGASSRLLVTGTLRAELPRTGRSAADHVTNNVTERWAGAVPLRHAFRQPACPARHPSAGTARSAGRRRAARGGHAQGGRDPGAARSGRASLCAGRARRPALARVGRHGRARCASSDALDAARGGRATVRSTSVVTGSTLTAGQRAGSISPNSSGSRARTASRTSPAAAVPRLADRSWRASRCATASSSTTGARRGRPAVERTVLGVLDRLAVAREAAGDLPGAIEAAGRRLDLDPLDEAAHVRLMDLYAAIGRPRGGHPSIPGLRRDPRARARSRAAGHDDRTLRGDPRRPDPRRAGGLHARVRGLAAWSGRRGPGRGRAVPAARRPGRGAATGGRRAPSGRCERWFGSSPSSARRGSARRHSARRSRRRSAAGGGLVIGASAYRRRTHHRRTRHSSRRFAASAPDPTAPAVSRCDRPGDARRACPPVADDRLRDIGRPRRWRSAARDRLIAALADGLTTLAPAATSRGCSGSTTSSGPTGRRWRPSRSSLADSPGAASSSCLPGVPRTSTRTGPRSPGGSP